MERVGFGFPGLRNLTHFDLPVFITGVALKGSLNETGINNLNGVYRQGLD